VLVPLLEIEPTIHIPDVGPAAALANRLPEQGLERIDSV
jgi:hypothetical protein